MRNVIINDLRYISWLRWLFLIICRFFRFDFSRRHENSFSFCIFLFKINLRKWIRYSIFILNFEEFKFNSSFEFCVLSFDTSLIYFTQQTSFKNFSRVCISTIIFVFVMFESTLFFKSTWRRIFMFFRWSWTRMIIIISNVCELYELRWS